MAINDAPIPAQDPIAQPHREEYKGRPDPLEGMLTPRWLDWFTSLITQVGNSAQRLNVTSVVNSGASIAPTDVGGGPFNGGLYRLSWYAQITRAAGATSSLTVTFAWTTGAVSQTTSGTAIVNGLTTTHQSGEILVRVDPVSPITYSTTYASTGAPSMTYSLDVVIENVRA